MLFGPKSMKFNYISIVQKIAEGNYVNEFEASRGMSATIVALTFVEPQINLNFRERSIE